MKLIITVFGQQLKGREAMALTEKVARECVVCRVQEEEVVQVDTQVREEILRLIPKEFQKGLTWMDKIDAPTKDDELLMVGLEATTGEKIYIGSPAASYEDDLPVADTLPASALLHDFQEELTGGELPEVRAMWC